MASEFEESLAKLDEARRGREAQQVPLKAPGNEESPTDPQISPENIPSEDILEAGRALTETTGIKIVGTNDEGKYLFENEEDGNLKTFDVQSYFKEAANIDIEDNDQFLDFKINTPDTAFQQMPPALRGATGLSQRLLFSIGNQAGTVAKLQTIFGKNNVRFDKEGGIVMREGRDWFTLDPDGMGIGSTSEKIFEFSRDIGEHINDLAIRTAAIAKGAAVGAAVAGPVGAIIGGGLAAVGAELATRQSLGRVLGVYKADAGETVKDLAFEGMLGMGGEVVVLGARLGLPALGRAAAAINRNSSNATKGLVSEVMGVWQGTGPDAVRVLLENSTQVTNTMAKFSVGLRGAGDFNRYAQRIRQEGFRETRKLFNEFSDHTFKRYGDGLESIMVEAEARGMKVNLTEFADDIFKEAEREGLVFIKRTPNGTVKGFRAFTEAEVAKLPPGTPLPNPLAVQGVIDALKSVATISKLGKVNGKLAAQRLNELNKNLNTNAKAAFSAGNSAAHKAFQKTATGVRTKLNESFDKIGLGKEYSNLQKFWQDNKAALDTALKAAGKNDDKAIETIFDAINSSGRRKTNEKALRDIMVGALGKRGLQLEKNLDILHSAEMYGKWLPHMGLLQASALGNVAANIGAGEASLLRLSAVGLQMSPKAFAKQVEIALRFKDFMKRMANFGLSEKLVGNSEALNTIIRSTIQAPAIKENADKALNSIIDGATSFLPPDEPEGEQSGR